MNTSNDAHYPITEANHKGTYHAPVLFEYGEINSLTLFGGTGPGDFTVSTALS